MMRNKRARADLLTCRRLLKKYTDKKLSVVIAQLEAKLTPGRRGRKPTSEEKLSAMHAAIEYMQKATGCNVTEARRLYARYAGRKSARHVEKLDADAKAWAEFLSSDEEDAHAVEDVRKWLQAKRLLRPTTLKFPQE